MNDQKKRFIVFSILVFSGFSGAFLFLKKNSPTTETTIATEQPKDTLVSVSLLSEYFDFENSGDASTSSEKAFSGKKSSKLSPTLEYGFGVNHLLGDIPSYKKLTSVSLVFECITENMDTSALYVFAINDKNGKNIYWNGVPIRSMKKDSWSNDSIHFKIKPEFLIPENAITFYAWNRNKKIIFIDDLTINYYGTVEAKTTSQKEATNTNFFFDFETTTGLNGIETIKETTAHSGKFACDLSGNKEYGPSIIKKIKDVSKEPIKKIKLSIWLYPLTDNPNTVITASVTNSKNETVFWDGKSSENKHFPKNQWSKINAAFDLPIEKITPEDLLTVNIWNKGKSDVLVDDLEIVYGENAERRGAPSTLDANAIYEKHFIAKRNKPPFKTIWLQKQEIKNENSTSLVADKKSITAEFSPNDSFLTGNFFTEKNNLDEVICIKSTGVGMFGYSQEKKGFLKIWETLNRNDSIWNEINSFSFGDFNNDGKSEVLVLNKSNQDWCLIDFDGKKWNVRSKGNKNNLNKTWISKFEPPTFGNSKDVFRSSDILYPGNYFGEASPETLKLNTDWRFDLKLVEQQKDGYTILGNVDFKGYPNDNNPKYYEFVKIISGKFLVSSKTSLIVMMRNCADSNFNGTQCNLFESLPELPNSTQVYSFEGDATN
jgi:hypothetical protein